MYVTEERYLIFERSAEFRHEFLDGRIVLRPGASVEHATLQVNLIGELNTPRRGPGYEVFGSDLRVRVSSCMYTYPDLTIVLGKPKVKDEHDDVLLNPAVLFEVLSPSTEHFDRGIKLRRYREIESLTDYILVAQDQIRIEQYTRGEAVAWTFRDYQRAADVLHIPSIGVSMPLAAIYERIEFPAE